MKAKDVILPKGWNAAESCIVDKMIARERLGPGVYSCSFELAESWSDKSTPLKVTENDPAASGSADSAAPPPAASPEIRPLESAMPALEDVPRKAVAAPHEEEPAHKKQKSTVEEPAPKRQKGTLEMEEEESAAEASNPEATLEALAKSIANAFEQGLIYSDSMLNPTTVAFFLRSYATVHLERAKAQWPEGKAPAKSLMFARFVLKQLMGSDAALRLGCISHLLPHLQKLKLLDDPTIDRLAPRKTQTLRKSQSATFKVLLSMKCRGAAKGEGVPPGGSEM